MKEEQLTLRLIHREPTAKINKMIDLIVVSKQFSLL
jgi:hypothetical protein